TIYWGVGFTASSTSLGASLFAAKHAALGDLAVVAQGLVRHDRIPIRGERVRVVAVAVAVVVGGGEATQLAVEAERVVLQCPGVALLSNQRADYEIPFARGMYGAWICDNIVHVR